MKGDWLEALEVLEESLREFVHIVSSAFILASLLALAAFVDFVVRP